MLRISGVFELHVIKNGHYLFIQTMYTPNYSSSGVVLIIGSMELSEVQFLFLKNSV